MCFGTVCPIFAPSNVTQAPRKKSEGHRSNNTQEKLPFPWPQGPKLKKPNGPNAGLRYGSKLLSALQIICSDVDLTPIGACRSPFGGGMMLNSKRIEEVRFGHLINLRSWREICKLIH